MNVGTYDSERAACLDWKLIVETDPAPVPGHLERLQEATEAYAEAACEFRLQEKPPGAATSTKFRRP